MTIILDLMTSKVIAISSIFVVVGILLYLSLRFINFKRARIASAIQRVGMDAMIIGVSLISLYTFAYIIVA